MREDKQGAMEAFSALSLAIRAMTGMVLDLVPDENRMKAAAGEGYATATDLGAWLVRTLKMPFRDAHHVTGRIVGLASKQGVALHELPLKAMQEVEPKITADALKVLSVDSSVKSRTSFGGTAPKNVAGPAKNPGKAAGKTAKVGPASQISLGFHVYPGLARPKQSLYGAARIGDFEVISKRRLTPSGWAIIALSVAALALGGCGRKGGLDLPPNAMNAASDAAPDG